MPNNLMAFMLADFPPHRIILQVRLPGLAQILLRDHARAIGRLPAMELRADVGGHVHHIRLDRAGGSQRIAVEIFPFRRNRIPRLDDIRFTVVRVGFGITDMHHGGTHADGVKHLPPQKPRIPCVEVRRVLPGGHDAQIPGERRGDVAVAELLSGQSQEGNVLHIRKQVFAGGIIPIKIIFGIIRDAALHTQQVTNRDRFRRFRRRQRKIGVYFYNRRIPIEQPLVNQRGHHHRGH